jgi:predicted Zn-dependent protease
MHPVKPRKASRRAWPSLERLEERLALYSTSGNLWANPQLITISFVPDGTVVGQSVNGPIYSNFQSSMNALFGDPSVWQTEILRAAQAWAKSANLNFALVSDNGAAIGTGSYQQGDPGFGDIRIGGYDFGTSTLAQSYLPPPVNNYSIAGDIQFNTAQMWNVGADYDLFTVANHELGHALGLYHSSTVSASMYAAYTTVKSDLASDDVAGVQAIYGARPSDSYDAAASNGTAATATNLTSVINTWNRTATVNGLDLSSTSDVDWYKFTVPAGQTGTMRIVVQSDGLSLLTPKVQLYASDGVTLLGTATGLGDYNGTTVTLSRASVAPGTVFYVKVSGAETQSGGWQAFNTGKYGLTLKFGSVEPAALTMPNTQTPNGNPLQGGGGQAIAYQPPFQANTTTSGVQQTSDDAMQAVAMDANGNYVVVWSSCGQDGSGWGVYAQRYDYQGNRIGGEFRVNTTTAGDQSTAAVAMDNAGNFVVVWLSYGQDGSGYGVYGQRFNSSGAAQGGEFRVNTTTYDDQIGPSIAMDATGDFVVTWTSYSQDGYGAGVYAQRYNASGLKQGGEFRVNTTTAGNQDYSRVAMSDAGSFVVVWSDDAKDGSSYGIYAQRFDASGVAQGGEFRVNTTTADSQDYASVAMNAAGDFVVTWSGYASDGTGWNVYAQRYSAAGAALNGEILVNDATAGDQMHSAAAMDQYGNIMITWQSWSSSTGWDVYGQQFTSSGARQGSSFLVNSSYTGGDQQYASVTLSNNGKAVVVWSGAAAAGTDEISGQLYLVNGSNGMHNMEAKPHGFGRGGCTCPLCTAAAALQQVAQKATEGAAGGAPVVVSPSSPSTPQGGTTLAGPQTLAAPFDAGAAVAAASAGDLWDALSGPSAPKGDGAGGAGRDAALESAILVRWSGDLLSAAPAGEEAPDVSSAPVEASGDGASDACFANLDDTDPLHTAVWE